MDFKCTKCEKTFINRFAFLGHCSSHNRGLAYKEKRETEKSKLRNNESKKFICKFCNNEFINGLVLGGHITSCELNPRYEEIKESRFDKWSSFSIKYNDITFHSTWEVKYAKWLDDQNIKWSRPNKGFSYLYNNKILKYYPDFFLIQSNLFIEIKGYETLKDKAKWESFPLNLKILRYSDLVKLKVL